METLQEGIARMHITQVDDSMGNKGTSPPPLSRVVETKRRLIERYYGDVSTYRDCNTNVF
jgi:hypothetical protein